MNGSNGNIAGLLERIASATELTNERLDAVERQQQRTNERLEAFERGQQQMREDMNRGFQQVNTRFDRALTFMGGHHTDHEQRIKALEEQVFKKSS
jgi:hypothetical protein